MSGPYPAIDADFALESRDGSVSPMRVVREMAQNAAIHGAPTMQRVLDDAVSDYNRQSARASAVRDALKALLFSLHARPFHGATLKPVEDAIAEANAVLDAQMPGADHD